MAVGRFPIDVPRTLGRFGMDGDSHESFVQGVCELDGQTVRLETTRPLLSQSSDQSASEGSGDESFNLSVQGYLSDRGQKATLVGAETTRSTVNHSLTADRPAQHEYAADWIIIGEHLAAGGEITGARVYSSHLAAWSRFGKVEPEWTASKDGYKRYGGFFETPAPLETEFRLPQHEATTLRLVADSPIPELSALGMSIQPVSFFELSELNGWTLDHVLLDFVRPVETLFTLLAGEQSRIVRLEVEIAGNWCRVFGRGIYSTSELAKHPRNLLLTIDDFPVDRVANWCAKLHEITPAPQVVATAFSRVFPTIETESLALATAAEGLHRSLYPDSRKFSTAVVAESLDALKASEVPEDVRTVLMTALSQYLYADSFPDRLEQLANDVSTAVPTCVGRTNRWKRAMADLRHQQAHSLEVGRVPTDESLNDMIATSLSLRWTLTFRMLQHAGVSNASLAAAVESSTAYQNARSIWQTQLPKVFEE